MCAVQRAPCNFRTILTRTSVVSSFWKIMSALWYCNTELWGMFWTTAELQRSRFWSYSLCFLSCAVLCWCFQTAQKLTIDNQPKYDRTRLVRDCIILVYLLTYSMVQSPSWEANWCAASQEIPRIFVWNPKVHYCIHKRPPPVPVLGQPNPVNIPTSYLLEIILILSTHLRLGLPSVLFPPVSPPRPYTPPLLTHTRHMPSPSHSSRFYRPHNIGWGVQII